MKTLTMRRKGEFTVKTFGDNPCGTEPDQTVKFRLTCVCTTQLDARGFLFDQMAVQAFFDDVIETDMSCEELVEEAVKGIIARVAEENPTCLLKKIRLTLSPAPHVSSMTLAIRGDDLRKLTHDLEDTHYESTFMKDEDAEPRTESSAPSLAKKASLRLPPVYGIYHSFRNEWVTLDGKPLAFPTEEAANEEREAEHGRRYEVRVIPREEAPSAIKSGLAPAPAATGYAKRYGIWNSKTSSWMHAKGWDRVFNSASDADRKVSEKVNGSNGSNWIHCAPRPYTGDRDRDNPKHGVGPLPSRELGTDDARSSRSSGCGGDDDYN